MTKAELGHEQQVDQMDRHLVAGRYRLVARIGRGQLGEIYQADDEGHRDLGVGRSVAIQLLPDRVTTDQGLFNKLKLGYTVLRAAPHPNIVPFLDFDHDGKFGYLVTDFLEGASLRFILDDNATLPLDEAIPVIRAVGDALQFLHANSMVHGRLTAESVFITENLEVRLLDVVPLDSVTTILRGVASRDPFSRCDVADDIYGLACLAYEMLVGKHPFNFHPLAEARHAGLEPTRIDSLPEKQWNALCRALSFEREQRTPTVADFLREFGIKGTERLRLSEDEMTKRSPSSSLPVNEMPPTWTGPVSRRKDAREVAHAKGKRARRMPSPILVMALVGLGAWFFYGQPRDDVVRLIDFVDSYFDGKSPGSDDGGSPTNASDVTPTASRDAESANILSATATQSVAEDDAATDELAGTSDTDGSSKSESEFTLIQSVVYVSERDGAARITTRRPGNTAGQIFWWTSDNTAIAEKDYIPIDKPVKGFASGEEIETLHIPLVNDSLPELRENFYVYLGRQNAQLGRLEPLSRIRVEINDDD